MFLTAFWIAASLMCAPGLRAQEGAPVFSDTGGLNSPLAHERDLALRALARDALLENARSALRDGSQAAELVQAIDLVSRERSTADIPLIAPFIVHLEPEVAQTAMQALRGYGTSALPVISTLGSDVLDAPTRRRAQEQLLKDHIRACCLRDRAVNPYHLQYEGRFDELYSVQSDVNTLIVNQLREALPAVRQDLAGVYFNRRYIYGWTPDLEPEFITYGALAVAALASKAPDVLKREVWDLVDTETNNNMYYYGGQVRESVTRELCFFFALNGRPDHLLKLVGDLDLSTRWQQDRGYLAGVHCEIAGCLMAGRGDLAQISERLDTALQLTDATGMPVASHARYLRARLRMLQGDEGGALRDIEESVEASSQPPLMVGVDSVFKPLAEERRFKTVLSYIELVSRRVPASERPFKRQDR